jgi:hypothetical protein
LDFGFWILDFGFWQDGLGDRCKGAWKILGFGWGIEA